MTPSARGADVLTTFARPRHIPVLEEAIVGFLARPHAVLIDATIGDGGHAAALLRASGNKARLLGIDLDRESVVRASETLRPFTGQVQVVHDTFAHLQRVATRMHITEPTGILFDLGMATHHLGVERGFSFKNLGTLDMRFDVTGTIQLPDPDMPALQRLAHRKPSYTAADILAHLRQEELAAVLMEYGEERHAERIADAIVSARKRALVTAVPELVQLVVRALPPAARHRRIHAATKTFQALRIAVNRELESLREGLRGAVALLTSGGRLAVVSFHSGEDRIVKIFFREQAAHGAYRLLTKHPVQPSAAERKANPWSRSARLRVIERHER